VTRQEFYKLMADQAARKVEVAPDEMKPDLMAVTERWRSLAKLAEAHQWTDPSTFQLQCDSHDDGPNH
jgi:hypothetical protein